MWVAFSSHVRGIADGRYDENSYFPAVLEEMASSAAPASCGSGVTSPGRVDVAGLKCRRGGGWDAVPHRRPVSSFLVG